MGSFLPHRPIERNGLITCKNILIIGKSPYGLAKEMKSAIERAFVQAGELWVDKILPKHFTTRAASEYDYKPRTSRYQLKKLRKFGHQNPLMFTGQAYRELPRWHRIKASV